MPDKHNARVRTMLSEIAHCLDQMDETALDRLAQTILDAGTVFTAGAGRSGLLLRCAAMRLMHLGLRAYVVGEVATPAVRAGDVLLIVSGSGETESLVVMAGKAKALGAKVGLVTANPGSSLGRTADVVVPLPAPTPKAAAAGSGLASVQPMGNLFEQSAFLMLDALVMDLMDRLDTTSERMFTRHANLE